MTKSTTLGASPPGRGLRPKTCNITTTTTTNNNNNNNKVFNKVFNLDLDNCYRTKQSADKKIYLDAIFTSYKQNWQIVLTPSSQNPVTIGNLIKCTKKEFIKQITEFRPKEYITISVHKDKDNDGRYIYIYPSAPAPAPAPESQHGGKRRRILRRSRKVSFFPGTSANAYPQKEYVYHELEMSMTQDIIDCKD